MPVWGALLATLGYNYARHRRGKSTLCSVARPIIPRPLFVAAWAGLTSWLIPHFCRRIAAIAEDGESWPTRH